MSKRWWVIGVVTSIILLALALLVVAGPKPAFSADLRRQLSFIPLAPDNPKKLTLAPNTVKYDPKQMILSYEVGLAGTELKITVSEQATPEQFVDIPNYFDKFAESLRSKRIFDSPNGKVALLRPDQLGGSEVAVMNGRGVLLFAKPTKALRNDQWHALFDSFELVK